MLWLSPKKDVMVNEVIAEQNKQNIPDGFDEIRQAMKDGLTGVWAAHNISEEQWAAKQAYISLGTTLNTAQELGLDVCPSEGFDPKAVMEVLASDGLADATHENVVVGMFVGKVDTSQDFHHFFNKSRKAPEKAYKIIE
ncbi:nitroreductase family protein [Spiroplasma clarkii]|uniref:nitroreductase family protein n=2 Tax=Spiroplasma clarkii TaxID=2139 RepID=UPI001474976D|nr:nitroreductase family protein [Spiroplasma clarkii]